MASGDTLATFYPTDIEAPTANLARFTTRNNHPCLKFDTTTAWTAIFTGTMPRHYTGSGTTVYVQSVHDAITGTAGWLVSYERLDAATDMDADSFAAAQTVTAGTVPGTSGFKLIQSVTFTNGAQMDSVTAGDEFRLKITRDVANDNAANYSYITSVEIKET